MTSNFIYINLDGFGRYYYDAINDKEKMLPNITALIKDGVFFENAYTGIPSITYPMQCAIVSGAYSDETGNCYQYLDRDANEIVLMKRYNKAQTIGELLRDEKIPFVSIQQFTLLEHGSEYGNKDYLYIQPRGSAAGRFSILEKLIRHGVIEYQGEEYRYDSLPKAIFMYVDDLDSIGHNPDYYSAANENERIRNVTAHLRYIDLSIGDIISALKEKNLYDSTTILLTTDHGMIHYKGESHIPALKDALINLGFEKIYCHGPGALPDDDYDVVITSHDIQCQVYFKKQEDLKKIKAALLKQPFVDMVMTKDDLIENAVTPIYADLLVSPVEGGHFSVVKEYVDTLKATHDSLNEKCRRVFAVISGKGVIKGLTYEPKVDVIDFMPTMCHYLGLPKLKNSNGKVLNDILNEH